MSNLLSLDQYWKLPVGFVAGTSLPNGQRICDLREHPGQARLPRRFRLAGTSVFCPDNWDSAADGWDEVLQLCDPGSGTPLAAIARELDGALRLPFDIESVIRTFQMERYVSSKDRFGTLNYLRRAYYLLRPLIPRLVQIKLRQSIAPLQGKRDFPVWPLDTSLDDFQQVILGLLLRTSGIDAVPMIWFWPAGHLYAVVLTHDVETQAGHDNLWSIVDLERRHGFRSSWNFVPERYQISSRNLRDLQAEGFEVGVHGLYHDGHLFDSYQVFRERAKAINHYLDVWNSVGFRAPSAIRNLEWIAQDINALYDTSCPTVEVHAPQPGGCCSIFPFMIGGLVELPFTLPQDHTVFTILGLDESVWFEVGSRIMNRHGLINIIVHPDYMLTPRNLARYEAFLEWLRLQSRDGWFVLPKEVASWWRNRSQQQLTFASGKWEVHGPEASRANIAWIFVQDNDLAMKSELSADVARV